MTRTAVPRSFPRFLANGLGILVFALLPGRPGFGQPLPASAFKKINQPGFGTAQNSFSWSMAWFQGNLYVGTNRDFLCVEKATEAFYNVGLYTTNPAPCVTCPASPYDMDLRAEIWRYAPATGQWDRVYQSPADLPNPKAPGKFVARDIGYRGMVAFTEADGTEALYVLGATAREYIPGLPPPRILRSTDGVNFVPIPQDPGTTLGSLNAVTFRASAVYNNRLYVSASPSMIGDGFVLEAANPELGNSSFRQVTPANLLVYELNTFNGYLYIGAGDQTLGYSVWKTDATGTPPYTLTPVVTGGAGRGSAMASVVSMHVFNDRLYVGAAAWFPTLDLTCEMIRINPDDSWQVVVGNPRLTSSGLQWPISGFTDGFGNPYNAHIWRMEDHQGALYAGTNDDSGGLGGIPVVNLLPALANQYGFDLFASADGRYWTQITQNAFGNSFDFGCRSITSTPVGLFLGSTDYAQGTSVWLAGGAAATASTAGLASGLARPGAVTPSVATQVAAPSRLSVEPEGTTNVVSWAPVPAAARYQVFRADYRLEPKAGLGDAPPGFGPRVEPPATPAPIELQATAPNRSPTNVWVRGPFTPIATTAQTYFQDAGAKQGGRSVYFVRAEDQGGRSSGPSNSATMPFLGPVATFATAESELRALVEKGKNKAKFAAALLRDLKHAREAAAKGDITQASRSLDSLHNRVARNEDDVLAPSEAEDLEATVSQLQRRVELTRAGALERATLLQPRRSVSLAGPSTPAKPRRNQRNTKAQ